MGRIINTEIIGKERNRLAKGIVLAIRELTRKDEVGMDVRDLAAFIIFSLESISKSIEITVNAWEKRDYWVKADRFRMEWAWAGVISEKMSNALVIEDWRMIAELVGQIGQKLSKIKIAERNQLGTPWKGCWKEYLVLMNKSYSS
jgi:hypothetical protein